LLRAGKALDAVDVMMDAVSRVPTDVGVQHTLGVARMAAELWEEAIASFRTVLTLEHENAEARIAMAGAYMRLRRYDEAEQVLKEVLQADNESVRAMISLGKLALLKSNKSKAEEYFRQALKLDPDNEDAMEQLKYFTPHGNSISS
jgi:Flp pilus assembly protein TadD